LTLNLSLTCSMVLKGGEEHGTNQDHTVPGL
jgi:hypothetical protein